MPWDAGGGDYKRSHSHKQTAIVDLFKRRRNKFGQMTPSGQMPGSIAYLVATAVADIVAYYALTFRVDANWVLSCASARSPGWSRPACTFACPIQSMRYASPR
jgi:hypothetical protein